MDIYVGPQVHEYPSSCVFLKYATSNVLYVIPNIMTCAQKMPICSLIMFACLILSFGKEYLKNKRLLLFLSANLKFYLGGQVYTEATENNV